LYLTDTSLYMCVCVLNTSGWQTLKNKYKQVTNQFHGFCLRKSAVTQPPINLALYGRTVWHLFTRTHRGHCSGPPGFSLLRHPLYHETVSADSSV